MKLLKLVTFLRKIKILYPYLDDHILSNAVSHRLPLHLSPYVVNVQSRLTNKHIVFQNPVLKLTYHHLKTHNPNLVIEQNYSSGEKQYLPYEKYFYGMNLLSGEIREADYLYSTEFSTKVRYLTHSSQARPKCRGKILLLNYDYLLTLSDDKLLMAKKSLTGINKIYESISLHQRSSLVTYTPTEKKIIKTLADMVMDKLTITRTYPNKIKNQAELTSTRKGIKKLLDPGTKSLVEKIEQEKYDDITFEDIYSMLA